MQYTQIFWHMDTFIFGHARHFNQRVDNKIRRTTSRKKENYVWGYRGYCIAQMYWHGKKLCKKIWHENLYFIILQSYTRLLLLWFSSVETYLCLTDLDLNKGKAKVHTYL